MYDVVGIGAGVFNLSLAALLDDIQHESHLFLEKKESFDWYPGLNTEVSDLQDDYLGDLVTLANPTSRFGVLSYLHERGLLYQFIGRKQIPLSRRIFSEYFLWVAKKLTRINYSSEVKEIRFDRDHFAIKTDHLEYHAKNIVLGVGLKTRLPGFVEPIVGQHIYHSSVYSDRNNNMDGKTIALIGGRQSSAEILLDIVNRYNPHKIIWISPDGYIAAMDYAAISYDLWSPTYLREFYKLSDHKRRALNGATINTSDGITSGTLNSLYAKLFDKKYFGEAGLESVVMTSTRLESAIAGTNTIDITVKNDLTLKKYMFRVDELILATGYTQPFRESLSTLIHDYPELNGEQIMQPDFSLKWEHGRTNRIYVQNGAINEYSILEKNLILAAWRSSVIINSLTGRELYKNPPDTTLHTYHDQIAAYEI